MQSIVHIWVQTRDDQTTQHNEKEDSDSFEEITEESEEGGLWDGGGIVNHKVIVVTDYKGFVQLQCV